MSNISIQTAQKFRYKIHSMGLSILLFVSFSVLLTQKIEAQGNLQITPKRIVFEGQKRIMEVVLVNSDLDSAKYSISFLQFRMTEDGAFEEINTPDSGQNFSDKNIRFFPRSVMLGPNETQIIRLQLSKSEQLAPGEYRSHLYFRSLTPRKALGEENSKNDSTVTVKIIPIFGITIPVIIRVGESNTTLNITDLKLETTDNGIRKLNFTLNRTGNMSAFGDILISHIAPNGKVTKIGLSEGVAIYTPNSLRRLKVDIETKSTIDLSKGTIRVVFLSQSDTHPQKLAEAELSL